MSRNRIIFYSIFAFYQVISFIIAAVVASYVSVNFSKLLDLSKHASIFKYISLLGVILICIDLVWSWRQTQIVKKEGEATRKENNVLKAKIYDLQQAGKEVSAAGSK